MAILLVNHTATIEINYNANLQHIIGKGSFDVTILTGTDVAGVTVNFVWILFRRDGQIKDNVSLDWREITPSVANAEELRDLILGWNIPPFVVTSSALPTGASTSDNQTNGSQKIQIVSSDGTLAKFADGKQRVSSMPYPYDIAKGNLPNHFAINKFGQNEDIGTGAFEDIWDGGGSYPYPADNAAPITHIYSTNAGDTQEIEVQGLDITGLLTLQTITLTGTTVSVLTTPLWRVFRLKNEGVTNNAGIIHASDAGKAVSYAQIAIGNNQTLMALWTVPLGMTAYMLTLDASMAGLKKDYVIDGHMYFRTLGKVFQIKRTFGLKASGTSSHNKVFEIPIKIDALTDIKISAISSAAGGVINASFAIIYEVV